MGAMNMGNLEKTVLERLAQAADWFFGHLTISEGRAERDIELALQVIAESAAEDALTGEGLIDARELFFDDLHAFCDDPAALQDAIPVAFEPPLETGEYALLFGLYLARAGIGCVVDSLPKQHLLAALLLADVMEAQSYWFGTRGLTRCRNPEPRLLKAEQNLERRVRDHDAPVVPVLSGRLAGEQQSAALYPRGEGRVDRRHVPAARLGGIRHPALAAQGDRAGDRRAARDAPSHCQQGRVEGFRQRAVVCRVHLRAALRPP